MGMDMADVHECIGNPLKLRILMLLARNGPMTAKTILQETGASQTTVYRALNGMQDAGIIRVVSETKVRAVTERTYDISFDFEHFDVDMVRENDLKGYCSMFGTFMLGLMRDFEEYSADPDADLNRDSTGFASTGVYLTDEQARERLFTGILDKDVGVDVFMKQLAETSGLKFVVSDNQVFVK